MENYLEVLTENVIKSHNIKNCMIISEKDWKPRMIIKYNDDSELSIDGDEEIKKYIKENF